MSNTLFIPVVEPITLLKQKLKKAIPLFAPRIRMLIEMKQAGSSGISKRALMERVGASSQSIHTWRTNYKNGGLTLLLSHHKTGFKPPTFNNEEHKELEKILHNPTNNITGYVELNEWVLKEFNKQVKYNTLLKYCIKHFQSKVKVARKSHIKKDDDAVATFKKTSVKSAKMQ